MRVVGGAKSDKKLVRRERMEDLWRPDRGEVREGGQRLLRRVCDGAEAGSSQV